MEEKLSLKTCEDFTEVLASKAPVPGGGGVAALVGALGVSLGSMVGNITSGRKKYAAYEQDIQRMIKDAGELRVELLELINKDAENFWPLQKAYSIPKDDPTRESVMEKVSLDACEAPFRMMELICKSIDLLVEMKEKGSVTVLSDVGCGALCCRAALECASMNIFINTKNLRLELVGDMVEKTNTMLSVYTKKADEISKEVFARLKN